MKKLIIIPLALLLLTLTIVPINAQGLDPVSIITQLVAKSAMWDGAVLHLPAGEAATSAQLQAIYKAGGPLISSKAELESWLIRAGWTQIEYTNDWKPSKDWKGPKGPMPPPPPALEVSFDEVQAMEPSELRQLGLAIVPLGLLLILVVGGGTFVFARR